MRLIAKLLWILFLAGIMYVLLVFVNPPIAKKIETAIGQPQLSEQIRGLKEKIDTLSNPSNTGSFLGSIGTFGQIPTIITETKGRIEKMSETVESISKSVDKKAEELNATIESVKKVGDSIDKLRGDMGALMTLGSGSSVSGSVSTEKANNAGTTEKGSGSIEDMIFTTK